MATAVEKLGRPTVTVPHVNRWLALLVVVLVVAAILVGGWLIVDQGRTDAEVFADDVTVALNEADTPALARLYAGDAVFVFGGEEFVGLNAVISRAHYLMSAGTEIERTGEAVRNGDYVAVPFVARVQGEMMTGMSVYSLGADGKILRHEAFGEWVPER